MYFYVCVYYTDHLCVYFPTYTLIVRNFGILVFKVGTCD